MWPLGLVEAVAELGDLKREHRHLFCVCVLIMCLFMCVYYCIDVYIHIYIYIYMHTYMYVCVYIYIYIYVERERDTQHITFVLFVS